jgi:ankyrin repeat protein
MTKYLIETYKMQITFLIVDMAIRSKDVDIIDYFLELGVNFNELENNSTQHTLLSTTIQDNSLITLDIIDRLLNGNVNVNEVYNYRQETVLTELCLHQYTDSSILIPIVKRLILFGANLNYQNYNNQTALHHACSHPINKLVVEMLLKYGADPNIFGAGNNTPLMVASKFPYRHNYIPLLLQAGANPTLKNKGGQTSIDMCNNEELKSLMIEKAKKFI